MNDEEFFELLTKSIPSFKKFTYNDCQYSIKKEGNQYVGSVEDFTLVAPSFPLAEHGVKHHIDSVLRYQEEE